MIKSFSIKNFQSFKEPVQVSFEQGKLTPNDQRSFIAPGEAKLSKAIAVIGANASGKTTLIKSLGFLYWFMKESFHMKIDETIPVAPHFSLPAEATEFELEFFFQDQEWKYKLVVTHERVLSESLHKKQTRSYSYVFTRDWDASSKSYLIKQQHFGMLQREAEKVRENASLISTAAQYEVPLAVDLKHLGFYTNTHVYGRQHMNDSQIYAAADFYANNEPIRAQMVKLLTDWDFGLSDLRIEKKSVTDENGESNEIYAPYGIHKVNDQEIKLFIKLESSGTQGAYLLLGRILPALESGGLVVIDELEADLHPHMLTPILDLFFSTKTNPKNAQIIFTCHSIEVLSLLHKSQIMLVEKNKQCHSDAWRLDTVKGVRNDDNLYAKYMAGAYGAIPHL
jgi:AAA15 family ATPase/GTPase